MVCRRLDDTQIFYIWAGIKIRIMNKLFYGKYSSLEDRVKSIPETEASALPEFLVYPRDPIARKMFEGKVKELFNWKCGYQFLLYTDIADTMPEIRHQQPTFECNETHIYRRSDSLSFISVSTMKSPGVKTSNIRNWVEAQHQMGLIFGNMTSFLNIPSGLEGGEYHHVNMHDLGREDAYNRLHGFEETHTYCHVFYLDKQLYKKFILVAKRDTVSWKVECTVPSETERLHPSDLIPPGMLFGSFFPLDK